MRFYVSALSFHHLAHLPRIAAGLKYTVWKEKENIFEQFYCFLLLAYGCACVFLVK